MVESRSRAKCVLGVPQGRKGVQLTPTQGSLPVAPCSLPLQGKPAPTLDPLKSVGAGCSRGMALGDRDFGWGHSTQNQRRPRAPPFTFDPPLSKSCRLWTPPLTEDGQRRDSTSWLPQMETQPGRTYCFPLRKLGQDSLRPDFHTPIHAPFPQSPSFSPETLGREAGPPEGWQGRACVCAHGCVPTDTPSARPSPSQWCPSYLGNWPQAQRKAGSEAPDLPRNALDVNCLPSCMTDFF